MDWIVSSKNICGSFRLWHLWMQFHLKKNLLQCKLVKQSPGECLICRAYHSVCDWVLLPFLIHCPGICTLGEQQKILQEHLSTWHPHGQPWLSSWLRPSAHDCCNHLGCKSMVIRSSFVCMYVCICVFLSFWHSVIWINNFKLEKKKLIHVDIIR